MHADNVGLSEKALLFLCANNMSFSSLIFKLSDILIQSWEQGCSFVRRCVGTAKIRTLKIDKLVLSARTDNVGCLSDRPGFFRKKTTLSADNVGFSEKPILSERNPYYLIR